MQLAIWYDVLVCHQYNNNNNNNNDCKDSVGSVYVSGYGGLSDSGLWVFRELCPARCLVVAESPSVSL